MDADYADDIEILANALTQAESLQHSLEQTAGGIGLNVNADKTKYMYFTQKGDISTLNSSSLKLVNKFTCLRGSVLSNDINMWLAKTRSAIDRLSIIWKANL